MKVEYPESVSGMVKYSQIKEGETFRSGRLKNVYIKSSVHVDRNGCFQPTGGMMTPFAVNLDTGRFGYFTPDVLVLPCPEAKVVFEKESS